MDPTPTPQPDSTADATGASEPSIEQQLDELLLAIEQQEPGTIEPDKLPDSFRAVPGKQQQEPGQPEPTAEPAPEEPAQAEASPPPPDAEPAGQADAAPAQQPEQADAPTPDPFAEAEAQAASQDNSAAEDEMLAALNAALKDLDPDETAKFGPPKQAPPPRPEPPPAQQATEDEAAPEAATEPAPAAAHEPSEDLTAEINALLNAPAPPEPPPAPPTAEPDDASTQDQIAEQIEDLLNSDQAAHNQDQDASIDDIDQMLAEEIDLDDELAGDFHSVQDITAGIKDAEPRPTAEDDEHAASARDVAAELDSQPEDQAEDQPAPAEDPYAALASIAETAEKNQAEHEQQLARAAFLDRLPRWLAWLGRIDAETIEAARLRLLRFCFVLNWPARRFLTTEWRANLGYLALIHLFIGVAMWLYLIVR